MGVGGEHRMLTLFSIFALIRFAPSPNCSLKTTSLMQIPGLIRFSMASHSIFSISRHSPKSMSCLSRQHIEKRKSGVHNPGLCLLARLLFAFPLLRILSWQNSAGTSPQEALNVSGLTFWGSLPGNSSTWISAICARGRIHFGYAQNSNRLWLMHNLEPPEMRALPFI